jgi:hypothetical protein
MRLVSRLGILVLKLYVAGALLVAAILSPAALSFVPVILLVWYLVTWRWRFSPNTDVLSRLFMLYALALFFSPVLGLWLSLVVCLPALAVFNRALEENARSITLKGGSQKRGLTGLGLTLFATILGVLIVALMLGNTVLILSDALAAIYFSTITMYSRRHFPVKPLDYEQLQFRCIVGKPSHVQILLNSFTRAGGSWLIKSPHDWLKVAQDTFSFQEVKCLLKLSFTPPFSGPSIIKLEGQAVDRWGLVQTGFEIEPLSLLVIPRARYAAWLARKYLAGTGAGNLPIVSNITSVKSLFGLRSGVEYYGNQQYQPGDSLKNIDWKHSIKFNELISKEFTESHGKPAILLTNLTASDSNEADKLAYDPVVAAISLAREGIPASLAAYNNEGVVLITPPLRESELVLRSLQTIKSINIISNPSRYLKPPDVVKLKANINRLRQVRNGPSDALAALLQIEYQSLSDNAKVHPCTLALARVKTRTPQRCSVLSVSLRNHDAEALEFNSYILSKNGDAIIDIRNTP